MEKGLQKGSNKILANDRKEKRTTKQRTRKRRTIKQRTIKKVIKKKATTMGTRSINEVKLIGNVGQKELIKVTEVADKKTGEMIKTAKMEVCTTESWKDENGDKIERSQWHRCILWRGLAKVVEEYVATGTRVYIAGRLEYRSYTDEKGEQKWMTEIIVTNLILLSYKDSPTENNAKEEYSPEFIAYMKNEYKEWQKAQNREKVPKEMIPIIEEVQNGKGNGKTKAITKKEV